MVCSTTSPIWRPTDDRLQNANVSRFRAVVESDWGAKIPDFPSLYRWSVDHPDRFWTSFRDFAGIRGEDWGGGTLDNGDDMPRARWFPDTRLNYTENLLRRRDETDALVFWGEGLVRRRWSHRQLHDQVSRLAQALQDAGVRSGDRVAGYLPNLPETIATVLATASIGAVWSSCSPDFGVEGVVDRFGQIEPKVLFTADGYFYNGVARDCLGKLADIAPRLPSLKRIVVVPYAQEEPDISGVPGAVLWDDFTGPFTAGEIAYARLPFNHPLYILYSSGTTGPPKCIVHGAGGTLLKHMTEHLLHCDIRPDDRVFYFTTCGWMMWNWQVSALACEAALLLYDGSPFHPSPAILFDYADAEHMTLFGTSAKYIDAVRKAGFEPVKSHRLDTLRTMTSTGSPLAPESFDFVYDHIKRDLHLASISGGSDIIGCFVLGDPTGPVWRGELQTRALTMAVDVFDDDGHPIRGEKGELVCKAPFISMPLGFWNDPDGARFRSAYFERFSGVWHHGDYVELTEHDGMIFHGRSDALLKPGGVRIGTAEIYRQVERLPEVIGSVVIGQDWEGDTRIVLFVKLGEGVTLSERLTNRIRTGIRTNCSPRHVPARIIQVADIPRTKSGKITELAVRDMVHGRPVRNVEALANPEALELFRDLPELRT